QGFPFVVADPTHWIYEGTGVALGDTLAHVVGYEWDVVSDNGSAPAGLEIVGDSLALHEYGYNSRATATVYYPTPASFVFGAGTIGWANGLSAPGLVDARLQRVTENILARAGLFPEAPVVIPEPAPPELGTSARAQVIAGSGSSGDGDGAALSAQFSGPGGVAASPSGALFVCDTNNNLLRQISATGQVSTLLGDKAQGKLRLATPTGIVVDATGIVFLSDTNNHRIISFSERDGAKVFAGAKQGYADASDPHRASFNGPRGLALDSAGALYVADFGNNAIRRIDASGVSTLVSEAGGPSALAVAADGTLYYVASWNGSIVRVLPDGTQAVLANTSSTFGDQSGPSASALLRPCEGLWLAPSGLVFSDTGNNRIRLLEFGATSTVSTLLGTGRSGSTVGDGTQTELWLPRGLCAFRAGYVVADSANHRILWFAKRPQDQLETEQSTTQNR
ncbi:MAG TPA: N,N-dimethylformamidase beta subunit family domain-containing protein, partial [Polyangiaceae bacterium]|nr:N,N-dimethylformamidase beta subunit family domain-containing protein [Polyangiaceae bacterium]